MRLAASDNRAKDGLRRGEDLLFAAGQYFAGDNPNPQNVGCPEPGTLRGLVGSNKLPDADVRSHLFNCSACFSLYRQTLERHRLQTQHVKAERSMAIPGKGKESDGYGYSVQKERTKRMT